MSRRLVPGLVDHNAHVAFPIIASLCAKLLKGSLIPVPSPGPITLCGAYDIPFPSRLNILVFLLSSISHMLFVATSLSRSLTTDLVYTMVKAPSFALSIMVWCCYTVWEMRRIRVFDLPLGVAWFSVLVSAVSCGPAATLAGVWIWREYALEKARLRQTMDLEAKKTITNLS